VAGGVAGHVHHRETQAEHLDHVAVGMRHAGLGNALARRPVHGPLQQRTQLVDAADMVGVVVRH